MSDVLTKNTPEAPQPMRLDVSGTSNPSFGRITWVEMRKMVDTLAGRWLVISMGILTVVVMAIQLIVGATTDTQLSYGDFIAGTTYSIGLLLPILGIMLLTGEWGQRTAMVTFSLVPNRMKVVFAKLAAGVVYAVASVAFAIVVGALANVLYGVVSGNELRWGVEGTMFAGFLLGQVLGMLTGFALAALLLNTASAIVLYFIYTFVVPTLVSMASALIGWFSDIAPWVDFAAAQAPLMQGSMSGSDWAHLGVTSLIWVGIPLFLGLWRVARAEVK